MTLQQDDDAGRHVAEIIEVAIHNILYLRQVYPPELFVRRKKFDVPVFQCASDALNDYISGVISEIGKELLQLQKIILILLDGEAALERYSFIIGARRSDAETISDWQSPENMGRQLRALFVKLIAIDSVLSPVIHSDSRTFSVVLEAKPDDKDQAPSQIPKSTSKQWALIPSQKTTALEGDHETVHVNTINIGHVQLALQIAELQK